MQNYKIRTNMADLRTQIRKQLQKSKSLEGVSFDNRNEFYFKNVEDGIFQHHMSVNHTLMFGKGSGSELQDKNNSLAKAKAIDSSSMLSYNFFHWVSDEFPLELFGNRYTQVFFEVRLKTLKSSNAPANIDVVLVDNEFKHALFVESKFLEYLESEKADFSESYSSKLHYFTGNQNIDKLINLVKDYQKTSGGYYGGIKQNICHLIALSNLKDESAIKYAREKNPELAQIFNANVEFKFINLIYEPCLEEPKKKYDDYIKLLTDFQDKLSSNLESLLTEKRISMSYSDLYKEFKKINSSNLPKGLINYLRDRYLTNNENSASL